MSNMPLYNVPFFLTIFRVRAICNFMSDLKNYFQIKNKMKK